MRQFEGLPPDPEVLDELEAIEATLLGLSVDPRHAELAELTVILAGERREISPEFARELDARVQRRFAAPAAGAASSADPGAVGAPRLARNRRQRRRGLLAGGSVLGVALAVAAAFLVVIVVRGGGISLNTGTTSTSTGLAGAPSPAYQNLNAAHVPSTSGTSKRAAASSFGGLSTPSSSSGASSAGSGASSSSSSNPVAADAPAAQTVATSPTPVPNGRHIIQSAQLDLTASDAHLDYVSQEVFNVVGQESGIVRSSSVTAGSDGYATFSLSIPSQNLQQTMNRLSQLRYSSVSSSTNSTQDVNDQYLSDQRALADARALRTSLLKQLANATTQAEIDSLTAQIHDAEASISSDEATLSGLQGRINYSSLSVQINAGPVIVPPPTPVNSSRFTIGRAGHDAVRVLTVAAGVSLIALAALVPVGLLVALGTWIAYAVRRRRREHALDAA